MIIGRLRFRQIIGRREPYPYLCTNHHEDITEEGHPNHFSSGLEPPQLREDIAQHISKREGDGTCVELEETENTHDLDGHNVGYQIECYEEGRDGH